MMGGGFHDRTDGGRMGALIYEKNCLKEVGGEKNEMVSMFNLGHVT